MSTIRLVVLATILLMSLSVAGTAVAGNGKGRGNGNVPPACLEDIGLQDSFLKALRKQAVPVAIYLVNGIKLQGTVEDFDASVILLQNTVSQMVYKHAISTIVPSRIPY